MMVPRLHPSDPTRRRVLLFSVTVAAGLLTCLAPVLATATAIPFDRHSLPVSDNPQDLSAVDCDGDGVPDLVTANFDADTATIFRGTGSGTFLHHANVETADQPSGATCADLDHDGRPDLAVASWSGGTVTLHLQLETGVYTHGGTFPVGHMPRTVTAADLDRDGTPDLVVVNQHSSDLTLLFGNGSGGIRDTATIPIPRVLPQASRPTSAKITDFDGDGWPDIVVVGNQRDPSITLLLGSPFGFRFSTGPLPHSDRLRSVAVGDLNGDALPDLAILGVDSSIRFFAGKGDGTFQPLTTQLAGTQARAIELADFDGDGLTDLAVASAGSNSIQILRAVAPGTFANPFSNASPTVVAPLASAQLRASNELVVVDPATRTLGMWQLLDTASPVSTPLASLAGLPQSLTLTDLTNDGIPDSVVPILDQKRQLRIAVLPGNATGGYDALPMASVACGNGVLDPGEACDDGNLKKGDGCSPICQVEGATAVHSLDAADFDGDGNADLALVDAKGELRLFFGNGHGQFARIRSLARVKRKTGATVGDFNGDGVPDLVIMPRTRAGGALTLLLNDGAGNFTSLAVATPIKLTAPLVAADFDRNGFDDVLAVAASKPKGLVLLKSDVSGPLRTTQRTPVSGTIATLAAADFDENGYLDTVVSFSGKKQAPLVLLGTLGGRFLSAPPLPADPGPARFAIADVDDDLHQDLVRCPGSGTGCRVYFGTGAGAFATQPLPAAPSIGRDVRGAAAADFDGDGWIDLAGVSRLANQLTVHFGGPSPSIARFETGNLPEAMAIVDLNGDGRRDLVVANAGSHDVSIFMNTGARHFVTLARTKLPAGSTGHVGLAVGDVDGDGRPDLAVTQASANRVTVLRNTGGAGLAVLAHLQTGKEPRGVAIGRLRDGGLAGLATANRGADSVSIFLAEADGNYSRTDLASRGRSPWGVVLPDLDLDGYGDLVVLNAIDSAPNAQEGNVITFRNDGSGGFPAVLQRHTRGRQTPVAICSGDFNGDDVPDVAIASITTADVMVLHGAGDGTWSGDERTFPLAHAVSALSCHDADGDGRTDIAFGRRRANDVGAILTGAP